MSSEKNGGNGRALECVSFVKKGVTTTYRVFRSYASSEVDGIMRSSNLLCQFISELAWTHLDERVQSVLNELSRSPGT